jgi:hypothetical protein
MKSRQGLVNAIMIHSTNLLKMSDKVLTEIDKELNDEKKA